VSQSDSFIDEVTEEVRRDRLYRLARRYGWIVVLVLVAAIGAAGYAEWRKAQAEAAAQALGDRLHAALDGTSPASRAAALAEIEADGTAGALVAMLQATARAPADALAAGETLEAVVARGDVPAVYRDAAALKAAMLRDNPVLNEERLALLEPLTAPGAPLRLLALEQAALVHLEMGARAEARSRLQQVAEDAEASAGQRQRVGQLLTVLGGDGEGA